MAATQLDLKLTFQLRTGLAPIGMYDCSVTKTDARDIQTSGFPSFARLKVGDRKAIVKVTKVDGGKGLVYINPELFPGINDLSAFTYVGVTGLRYVLYRTRYDTKLRVLVFALGAAIFGLIIDLLIAIGKINGIKAMEVSPSTIVLMTWIAMVLKVFGLGIGYYVSVRDGK